MDEMAVSDTCASATSPGRYGGLCKLGMVIAMSLASQKFRRYEGRF